MDRLLRFGCSPQVMDAVDDKDRVGILEAYGELYLTEEVPSMAASSAGLPTGASGTGVPGAPRFDCF